MMECEACHGIGWKETPHSRREPCSECGGRGTISPFLIWFDYQKLLEWEKKRIVKK